MAEPDLFERLAVEVSTNILSHLPTSTIRAMKLVNRDSRDIIGNRQNGSLIFRDRVEAAIRRLELETQHLLMLHPSNSSLTFADALSQFMCHRGIQASPTRRWLDIVAFVAQWRPTIARTNAAHPAMNDLMLLAGLLVDVHVLFHGAGAIRGMFGFTQPMATIGSRNMLSQYHARYHWLFQPLAAVLPVALLDPAKFTAVHDSLRLHGLRGKDGAVPKILQCNSSYCCCQPDWPLTKVATVDVECSASGFEVTGKRARQGGFWTVQQLRAILGTGLPDLPNPRTFAYCVRSKEAWNAVKWAVAGAKEGKHMSWRLRAMVLEEMYIY